MKQLLGFGFVMAVLVSQVQASDAPFAYYGEGTYGHTLDNKNSSFGYYFNMSFKSPTAWSITPETFNDVTFKKEDVSKVTFNHGFLRLTVSKKNLAKFGAFNYNLGYRYTPPTSAGLQANGGLGHFEYRPQFTGTVAGIDVSFRLIPRIYLVSQRYNTLGAGNKLIQFAEELDLSYAVPGLKNLSVLAYFYNSQTWTGAARGAADSGMGVGGFFLHSYGLGYDVDKLGNISAKITHDTSYQGGAEFRFFSDAAEISLSFSRAF